MHQKNIITAGKELTSASKVLILLHGRGGSAEDILSLSSHLNVKDYTLLAPQATEQHLVSLFISCTAITK
jgi:phospholipase/carboxylesterase